MEDAGSWDTEAAGADQKWDDRLSCQQYLPQNKRVQGRAWKFPRSPQQLLTEQNVFHRGVGNNISSTRG